MRTLFRIIKLKTYFQINLSKVYNLYLPKNVYSNLPKSNRLRQLNIYYLKKTFYYFNP